MGARSPGGPARLTAVYPARLAVGSRRPTKRLSSERGDAPVRDCQPASATVSKRDFCDEYLVQAGADTGDNREAGALASLSGTRARADVQNACGKRPIVWQTFRPEGEEGKGDAQNPNPRYACLRETGGREAGEAGRATSQRNAPGRCAAVAVVSPCP